MDNMEHAIERAVEVLDAVDRNHDLDSGDLASSEECARALAEAGLLAPAPLRIELRDSGDLGLTPGAFTQSRWATAWDDGYNAGKNDLRDNRVFRTRNPHRGAGQ